MKQIEYTFLTLFMYVMAYALLDIASYINTIAIWYASPVITFVQILAILFVGFGIGSAGFVMFTAVKNLNNFAKEKRTTRRR